VYPLAKVTGSILLFLLLAQLGGTAAIWLFNLFRSP